MLNKRTSDKSRISRFMPLCLYEKYELASLFTNWNKSEMDFGFNVCFAWSQPKAACTPSRQSGTTKQLLFCFCGKNSNCMKPKVSTWMSILFHNILFSHLTSNLWTFSWKETVLRKQLTWHRWHGMLSTMI